MTILLRDICFASDQMCIVIILPYCRLKETFDFLSSVPVIEKLFVADETEKMRLEMCEALRRMWNRFVLGKPDDEKKK